MHPLILTILISFLLPLLTTAKEPWTPWTPSHWPPPTQQFYYWGDMLNVTKCYCEDVTQASSPASYHLIEYRNFHNEQVYSLGWACESTRTVTGRGQDGPRRVKFPVPMCWNGHDSWREKKQKECIRTYNADTFCYELGDKKHPHDYYYFNGQKRGLPHEGFTDYSPDRCVALCRDELGGRTVASKCTLFTLVHPAFLFSFLFFHLLFLFGFWRSRKGLARE